MRINKYLAECGLGSRRKVEELILNNEITVNGTVCNVLSTEINDSDSVSYQGKNLVQELEKIVIMLNKPKGYITTVSDDKNRPVVIDLIKNINYRIYPVGRLDYNTEGLLLLTNNGEFDYNLTHPKHEIPKTYEVIYNKPLTEKEKNMLTCGVKIEDYVTAPAILSNEITLKNAYKINITIHEGKNRQVRKMFDAVNKNVINLKRVEIGNLNLGDLKVGEYKILNKSEIKKVFN